MAVPTAMHLLSIRKLERDGDELLIRSSLAAIHSYLTAYDRVSPTTISRILFEVQCPHGRESACAVSEITAEQDNESNSVMIG